MLTPAHSRAARGWLDWTQEQLAQGANVSLSTIRDFEKGRRIPIANNIDAIRRVLEANGVRMLEDNGRAAGIAIVDPGQVSVTPSAGSGTLPESAARE